MRLLRVSIVAAAAVFVLDACVVSAQHPYPPPPEPVLTAFDAELAPYGDFIVVAKVGRVWRPRLAVVGAGFVPYRSGGRWVLTSTGWVFESRWEFGWAVFHYGQWLELPTFGWVWVPGDQWAPAWVEWKMGGGYVAWAPAPPPFAASDWRPRWCFVDARLMAAEDWIELHLLPLDALPGAPVMSRLNREPGHLVPFGPPPAYIERRAGIPVRIHEATPPQGIGRVRVHPWTPPPPVVVPPPPPRPAPPTVVPAPPPRAPATPPRRVVPPPGSSAPAVKPPPPGQPTPPPGQPAPKERKPKERREPGARRLLFDHRTRMS